MAAVGASEAEELPRCGIREYRRNKKNARGVHYCWLVVETLSTSSRKPMLSFTVTNGSHIGTSMGWMPRYITDTGPVSYWDMKTGV